MIWRSVRLTPDAHAFTRRPAQALQYARIRSDKVTVVVARLRSVTESVTATERHRPRKGLNDRWLAKSPTRHEACTEHGRRLFP